MSRACPSCGSGRCGNHAACARNAEKRREEDGRALAGKIMWLVVGLAEHLYRKKVDAIISEKGPLAGRVLILAAGEHLKRTCVEDSLIYVENQMREKQAVHK